MRYHKWFTPWVMVIPALVFLGLFSLYPAINTLRLSFTNTQILTGGHFVGLREYRELWHDGLLRSAIVNSIVYLLVCVPLLTVLPLLLALLVQKKLPGIAFFRTVFYIPAVASVVAVALIWSWMLNTNGLINSIATRLHFVTTAIPFLTDRWLIVFSAISLTVWKGLGYYMVIYLTALANVSPELHEAAACDGAGAFRRFFAVTVPGVRQTMVLIAVLIMVSSIRVFSELYILTNGGGGVGGKASSIVMLIQSDGTGTSGLEGYASAMSVVLFLITIVPMVILARINRRVEA